MTRRLKCKAINELPLEIERHTDCDVVAIHRTDFSTEAKGTCLTPKSQFERRASLWVLVGRHHSTLCTDREIVCSLNVGTTLRSNQVNAVSGRHGHILARFDNDIKAKTPMRGDQRIAIEFAGPSATLDITGNSFNFEVADSVLLLMQQLRILHLVGNSSNRSGRIVCAGQGKLYPPSSVLFNVNDGNRKPPSGILPSNYQGNTPP